MTLTNNWNWEELLHTKNILFILQHHFRHIPSDQLIKILWLEYSQEYKVLVRLTWAIC